MANSKQSKIQANSPVKATRKRRKRRAASMDSAVFKVPEAARIARVGPKAIRDGIRKNIIPHVYFGRNVVIPRIAFLNWLNSWSGRTA